MDQEWNNVRNSSKGKKGFQKIDEADKKNCFMSVGLTDKQMILLDMFSSKHQVSKSDVVRMAIGELLK